MNDKTIGIINESHRAEPNEDGLSAMVRDFYTRKLMSSIILVWALATVFVGLAVFSAIHFFRTDQIREQILYATLFLWGVHEFGVTRIFVWQMAHRRNLKREIKRLELRVAELDEMPKAK